MWAYMFRYERTPSCATALEQCLCANWSPVPAKRLRRPGATGQTLLPACERSCRDDPASIRLAVLDGAVDGGAWHCFACGQLHGLAVLHPDPRCWSHGGVAAPGLVVGVRHGLDRHRAGSAEWLAVPCVHGPRAVTSSLGATIRGHSRGCRVGRDAGSHTVANAVSSDVSMVAVAIPAGAVANGTRSGGIVRRVWLRPARCGRGAVFRVRLPVSEV